MLFWHTIIYQSAFVYEVLWHNIKYIEISKFWRQKKGKSWTFLKGKTSNILELM